MENTAQSTAQEINEEQGRKYKQCAIELMGIVNDADIKFLRQVYTLIAAHNRRIN